MLYLNDSVFSILRVAGMKEILALHNVSDSVQKVEAKRFKMGKGFDLIGKKEIPSEIMLEPYQFMWIKFSY